MASYNRVVMVGNLTRDPEYKQLTSGQAVCRLGLASNRQFKNRQTGAMVQEVCYIDIDVWGPQAESCRQYLAKGRAVLVEGRLKLDSWEDQNGQNRSKHSIVADRVVFLASGAEAGAHAESDTADNSTSNLDANIERELMGQINDIKRRAKPAVAVKAPVAKPTRSSDTGEIDFKDEPPFQDDLPF
ncbi:MAG: single-stranded DNA-binding protein [Candidatus Babeliales bacterium]|nr:single-stranded DNA-binding protein [Candidatus Babeliales bacterium]